MASSSSSCSLDDDYVNSVYPSEITRYFNPHENIVFSSLTSRFGFVISREGSNFYMASIDIHKNNDTPFLAVMAKMEFKQPWSLNPNPLGNVVSACAYLDQLCVVTSTSITVYHQSRKVIAKKDLLSPTAVSPLCAMNDRFIVLSYGHHLLVCMIDKQTISVIIKHDFAQIVVGIELVGSTDELLITFKDNDAASVLYGISSILDFEKGGMMFVIDDDPDQDNWRLVEQQKCSLLNSGMQVIGCRVTPFEEMIQFSRNVASLLRQDVRQIIMKKIPDGSTILDCFYAKDLFFVHTLPNTVYIFYSDGNMAKLLVAEFSKKNDHKPFKSLHYEKGTLFILTRNGTLIKYKI